MEQSASIAKLSEALSKAQGVMEKASKDSSNPFFKSKYADLASVWDACRKPLTDHGLSIVQTADFIVDHPDLVCIETMLCHSSGEWLKGKLAVKPVKNDPQSVGSCITYLRRYSLQSMVGIAPEDDDGNAASGAKPNVKPIPQATQQAPQAPPDVPPQVETALAEDQVIVKITGVKSKTGETNGKKWTAYFIETATGEYGTFSETLADAARTYAESGELAVLTWKPGKKEGKKEVVSIGG